MEAEEWFKIKKYPHIGKPITIKDYDRVCKYVSNPKKIKEHSFLPFIHKQIKKRKFRADDINVKKNKSGKRKRVIGKPKIRDIYYASHLDSMVFSYYNSKLVSAYETKLKCEPFNNSIVAYRKIPVNLCSEKHKCNIDFAKSAFEFIKSHSNENLSVIVSDITSFFDHLDHKLLKKQWAFVLNETTLPDDHYNVYKALTRLRYIELKQLFKSYGKTMWVNRNLPYNPKKKIRKRIKINFPRYFKEKEAVSFCHKKEFIKNNLNLVISANNSRGIPQGSPISATLANIYMFDFDKIVFEKIDSINGFYQRYSDDLIIVCNQKYEDEIIDFLRESIKRKNLEIHPSKTVVYRFEKINDKFTGFRIDEFTKQPDSKHGLEYLGFVFDGQRVLIKNAGFSKYYRNMKRSFKRSASLALNSKNKDKKLFKSQLYKRFTYRGANRKLIYKPSKNDPNKYEVTKEFDWGNYLSYVKKANKVMRPINGSDALKRQSRKIWENFHKLINFHQNRINNKFKMYNNMNEDQIVSMSKLIQSYLIQHKLIDAKPKDLMPMLVEEGFFQKDHKDGLPLRKILRELDDASRLDLIPQVRVERKKKNRFWFFNAVNDNTINI